jgi:hypothetical protein
MFVLLASAECISKLQKYFQRKLKALKTFFFVLKKKITTLTEMLKKCRPFPFLERFSIVAEIHETLPD